MADDIEVNLSETAQDTPEATPPQDSDPEIAKLHKEAAAWRNKLRAEEKKTRDLEARIKALEAPMTDTTPPAEATPDHNHELIKRLEKLEADLKAEKQTTLRQSVAQEFSLPMSVVGALAADDPAELRRKAEEIKADIDKLIPPQQGAVPKLSIGNSGQSAAPTSAEDLLARVGRKRGGGQNPFAPRG